MKKKISNNMRTLSVVLSLLMVLSVITIPSFKAKAMGGTLDEFVERCYTVTLRRLEGKTVKRGSGRQRNSLWFSVQSRIYGKRKKQ